AFPPLCLLDLLARDERGTPVHRPARLLGARWLSMRNGVAGGKRHIDGPVVLSLFRVLAHCQASFSRSLLHVIHYPWPKSPVRPEVRNPTFTTRSPLRRRRANLKQALWRVLAKLGRVRRRAYAASSLGDPLLESYVRV